MSPYDVLLDQLRSADQRRTPAPLFDPTEHAASQRGFRKSLSAIGRGLSRIKAPPAPKEPTITPAEFLGKAMAAFRAGKISGDQLRTLEARHHNAIDALAARGGK